MGRVTAGLAGLAVLAAVGCSGPTPPGGSGMPGPGMGDAGSPRAASTCASPAPTGAGVVEVRLGEMGMASSGPAAPVEPPPRGEPMMMMVFPSRVVSGPITFVVHDVGRRPHELVVLPLGPQAAVGTRVPDTQGRIAETDNLGEVSSPCGLPPAEGLRPGQTGWMTVDLPAGRYELACNLPNHYADGMYRELDVADDAG